MTEVNQRVIEVMAAVLEMDPSLIPSDASPGVLEKWDSLRHMNLIVALEEEFSIRFPDELIEELISLKLIQLSIKELLA